jgi:hypothetical protein
MRRATRFITSSSSRASRFDVSSDLLRAANSAAVKSAARI